MTKQQWKGCAILLTAALIWGVAFIAQREGGEVGALTFVCLRSFLGALVLLPVAWLRSRKRPPATERERIQSRRQTLIGGVCCGLALFVASVTQQMGLATTTAGKAAFLTTLYILFVPLLGLLFGKKPSRLVWIGVGLATVGAYLLCEVSWGSALSRGDLLELLCAVCFSVHILVVDHFAPRVDCVWLSCVQFLTVGLLALPFLLLVEQPSLAQIANAAIPLLYVGILSSGVAYTLQMVGQTLTPVAVSPLLMSMESVFAALAGWLILKEALSVRELAGCVLIFAAVILSQWQPRPKKDT